ncbi:alpha/beta hydrolase [Parapedobacter deserti]|uniref:Alpha/beta hydrolase n=1 Tax=Parapedobacter deserti TaxID=1912957 RepID=A0ABV7JED4_9SPHI
MEFYDDEWYARRESQGKEIQYIVNGGRVCSGIIRPTLTLFEPSAANKKNIGVIICPGGGYAKLMMDKEGFRIAKSLADCGYTAFVLKYTLPAHGPSDGSPFDPVNDAWSAFHYLKENGNRLGIGLKKIGVMGFSAGGHVASSLATGMGVDHFDNNNINKQRPDFQILVYPVISFQPGIAHLKSKENLLGKSPSRELTEYFSNENHVDEATPPALILHAKDDETVPISHSELYHGALSKKGIATDFIEYEVGGHGFPKTPLYEEWFAECIRWLDYYFGPN